MANHTTGAQRHNARQDKIWDLALKLKRVADDEKTIAERKWQSGLKPNAEQKPCDHGLFGDEHLQRELFNGGVR